MQTTMFGKTKMGGMFGKISKKKLKELEEARKKKLQEIEDAKTPEQKMYEKLQQDSQTEAIRIYNEVEEQLLQMGFQVIGVPKQAQPDDLTLIRVEKVMIPMNYPTYKSIMDYRAEEARKKAEAEAKAAEGDTETVATADQEAQIVGEEATKAQESTEKPSEGAYESPE